MGKKDKSMKLRFKGVDKRVPLPSPPTATRAPPRCSTAAGAAADTARLASRLN